MRRTVVLAALAALALPTAASAKGVAALTVCGTDGCQKITAHAALRGFMDGGYETLAPEAAGPFFTVKATMRARRRAGRRLDGAVPARRQPHPRRGRLRQAGVDAAPPA